MNDVTDNQPPIIAMAMAMDRNKLIGQDGTLPWRIPGDLPRFKKITMGKPVLMGRKTFDSLGKPLSGRPNIVITRQPDWTSPGALVVHTLDDAVAKGVELLNGGDEIMVIGGAGLCRDAMDRTGRIYLTYIDHEFTGDTWLDSFDWQDWHEVEREDTDPTESGGYQVAYLVLERH